MKKKKILFLCTGNSCRSRMAEGWANFLWSDVIGAHSAGIEKHGLNPLAVRVMTESGVDIGGHTAKTIHELPESRFDWVITLCRHADATCPLFPGEAKKMHVPFDDPPALAKNASSEADALAHYRRVRDEIRAFVEMPPHEI